MKFKVKKYIYLVPGISILIIFILSYIVKGVYPFGKLTLVHGDLNLYIDTITFLINVIKNKTFSSLIFTNLIFSGNSNIILSSWYNPFFILYMLCFNTSRLLYFMSFIIVIKCILMAYSSYFCFNVLFGKENKTWNSIFSIVYALSGYVLINYATLMWMDIIVLYPLLIVSLKKLFFEYKFVWYSILLALCILICYQLSYMIIFSILATSLIAIKVLNIGEKKKIALTLGIGTILGICISGVYFFPVANVYINSARIGAEINVNRYFWSTKMAYIVFSSILVFGTIKSIKYRKKDKVVDFLLKSVLVTGILPVIFEGINIIWHGGQYDSYPFRYGFIPLFYMTLLTLYYFKIYIEKEFLYSKRQKNKIIYIDIYIVLILLLTISIINNSLSDVIFKILPITLLLLICYNFFINNLYKKILRSVSKEKIHIVFWIIIMLEIWILSLGTIETNLSVIGYQHSELTTKYGIDIERDLKDKLDYTSGYRYKDVDNLFLETLSINLQIPSIESWNLSNSEQVYAHDKLGYSRVVLRLNSSGGTILSDAIVGNRYFLVNRKLNSELYNYIDKTDSQISLYEVKEKFPFGIVHDSQNTIEKIPMNLDSLDVQNWIYHNLLNKKEDILTKLKLGKEYTYTQKNIEIEDDGNISFKKDDKGENFEDYYIEYQIDVNKKSILYMLYDNKLNKDTYMAFYIENLKNVEWNNFKISNENNLNYYPEFYNNNILDLGVYENETATIRFHF